MSSRSPAAHLEGATVIVTGASSGVGASLATAVARAGADPVLFARSAERLEEVARACRELGADPLVVRGDVTVMEDCRTLVERTIQRFGRLDVVVACAGLGMWARFDELEDPRILRRVMEVNYDGVAFPFYFALPYVRERRGMLVAISSVQGKLGVPYHTGYAASKHAVQGFCDSLRMELRGSGVGVLTVLAHWVRGTGMRERALGKDGASRGPAASTHGGSAVSVEALTRAVMAGIRGRKRTVFVPFWMRLVSVLAAVAPASTDRLIMGRVAREGSRRAGEAETSG